MSSIEIRKYEYQSTRAKNYFASPTYIDGITLNRITIEGFPIFNEEFANQFDSFEYKASDYDLVFSRLEDTLTTTLSDSLETFLSTDLDNHCLVCKVTIGDKTFGGLIDVNSIVFIDNLDSDGYKIKVTIFSIVKEFALFAQGSPPHPQGNTLTFNEYILGNTSVIWRGLDEETVPIYMRFDSNLMNWVSRVGYEPEIVRELWASLIDNDFANDCSTWKLFEDLCTAFGLIYKFDFANDYGDYFQIVMSVAFRDTGFSGDTVSVNWVDRQRGFISDLNANVIQCFKFMKRAEIIGTGTVPIRVDEDRFYGTVFDKERIETYDGNLTDPTAQEEGMIKNGDGLTILKENGVFPFSFTDKVNFVEMNYYFPTNYYVNNAWNYWVMAQDINGWYTTPQNRQAKYISFPRMFTKSGYEWLEYNFLNLPHDITIIRHADNIHTLWSDLVHNTGGTCYPFLLQTFKKYVSGKISLMDDFNVNLFDKIVVNGETYTIFKLSNLDFQNREVDLFAIQD